MAAFEATDRDVVVEFGGASVPVEQGVRMKVKLRQLFLSVKNVRKVRNPHSIPTLAATIKAEGLLYPLCVVEEKRKGAKAAGYGVVAGGRRLAALMLLVEQGHLSLDDEFECLLFDADRGVALSTTENSHEAMHAADQLEAFRRMVEDGRTIPQVAAAFGVSVLTVERRLALAALSPFFLDLFRNDRIGLDQLQALALTRDHGQQKSVWDALPSYDRSAHRIRKLLTEAEVSSNSPLAVFVGLQAYQEAGGTVRADLFDENSTVYLQDTTLLTKLAMEGLEKVAEQYRAVGWKWVEARLEFSSFDLGRSHKLHCASTKPSAQEKSAMDQVEAEKKGVDELLRGLRGLQAWDDEREEWGKLTQEQEVEMNSLTALSESLEAQFDAMRDALRIWKPKQRAASGVVVSIDSNGSLSVAEGLLRPEDRKAMADAASRAGVAQESVAGPAPKVRSEYSASLCQNMTAHRSAAVGASLTQNPTIALAVLVYTLVMRERESWLESPLGVQFADKSFDIGRNASEYDSTRAAAVFGEADALLKHLPGEPAALFSHLVATEMSELVKLLARAVGRSYSVQSPEPQRTSRGFDQAQGIEAALALDMADWWHPNIEAFLGHVPKSKMIEAVTESVGADAARPIEKMKKTDAIATAASLLDGRRWLPSTLRPYSALVVSFGDEADADEQDDEGGEQE